MNLLAKLFSKKYTSSKLITEEEVATLSPEVYGAGGLFGQTIVRPNDLLIQNKGYKIFKTMQEDDQIKPALLLKKLAMLSGGYEIQAEEDAASQEQKEFIEFLFEQMDGTIEKIMMDSFLALDFGYSIAEKVYTLSEGTAFPGKVILRNIKSKDISDFEFVVDEFGNLLPDGLYQLSRGTRLDISKFIIFSYNSQFGNIYGKSDLKSAYKPWFSKEIIQKGWNIYIERFGVPIATGLYNKNMQKSDQTILQNIFNSLQFKTSLVLPKDLIEELKIFETTGTGSDVFEHAIAYCDRAIARSLLVPDQIGIGSKESGSLAKAETHFDVFMLQIKQLQKEFAEIVMKEQIIKPLINFNYGKQSKYPCFHFLEAEAGNKQIIADLWIKAVTQGVVVQDLIDENVFRKLLEFPEKEEAAIPEEASVIGAQQEIKDTPDITPAVYTAMKPIVEKRELTKYEKRIDFREIEKSISEYEYNLFINLQVILLKQRDDLLKSIERKFINGVLTPSVISDLSLKFTPELINETKKNFVIVYNDSLKKAKTEITKVSKNAFVGKPITPEKALNYLANKALVVAGNISAQLNHQVKVELLKTLKEGLGIKETTRNLQDLYINYVGNDNTPEDMDKPYRLETIVRTNLNEAYNQGRKDAFQSSVEDGWVIGYQYSAIIDGRETDICHFLDGLIMDPSDPRTDKLIPPNHFNERSIIVPVTADEAPITYMTDEEYNQALTMREELNF